VLLRDGGVEIVPHPRDLDPSPLLGNIPASVSHRARIAAPMIRRGWLERGPGADRRRGRDEFVPVEWPRALDLVAAELRRVYAAYGPRAVFGGSYGWASAGRFHDAPRQVHRFLNMAGGYVRSVNSYSSGAATVILPHVIGPQRAVAGNNVSWDELVAHSGLVLPDVPVPVAGTEGLREQSLSISPDGQALFFVSAGTLKQVSAAGGNPTTIMENVTGSFGHGRRADARHGAYLGDRGLRPYASTGIASAATFCGRTSWAAATSNPKTRPGRRRSVIYRRRRSSGSRVAPRADAH
jgi:hypothetical protein